MPATNTETAQAVPTTNPAQPKPRPITREPSTAAPAPATSTPKGSQLSTNAAPPMSSNARATSGVSVSRPRNSAPITAPDPSLMATSVSPPVNTTTASQLAEPSPRRSAAYKYATKTRNMTKP